MPLDGTLRYQLDQENVELMPPLFQVYTLAKD